MGALLKWDILSKLKAVTTKSASDLCAAMEILTRQLGSSIGCPEKHRKVSARCAHQMHCTCSKLDSKIMSQFGSSKGVRNTEFNFDHSIISQTS